MSSTKKVAVGDGYNVPFLFMKEERKTQKASENAEGSSQFERGGIWKTFSDVV